METMNCLNGISREICSFLEAMMKADGEALLNVIFEGEVKEAQVSHGEMDKKYGFIIISGDGDTFCSYRKYGHAFGILRDNQ